MSLRYSSLLFFLLFEVPVYAQMASHDCASCQPRGGSAPVTEQAREVSEVILNQELKKLFERITPFIWGSKEEFAKQGIMRPFDALCIVPSGKGGLPQAGSEFSMNSFESFEKLKKISESSEKLDLRTAEILIESFGNALNDYQPKDRKVMSISQCRSQLNRIHEDLQRLKAVYKIPQDSSLLKTIENYSSFKGPLLGSAFRARPIDLSVIEKMKAKLDRELSEMNRMEAYLTERTRYKELQGLKGKLAVIDQKLAAKKGKKLYHLTDLTPLDPNWNGKWHKIEVFKMETR